ncbi:MAG: DNA-binding transcriptional regulator [Pseudomonadales bacterium]
MSNILEAVHQTAKGLHKAGVINKTTMRKFDTVCLTTVHDFTADQVKALRTKNQLSQPVFARFLNVSDKLVKKWEQGDSKPRGAALKMLVLAESKGIEAIS